MIYALNLFNIISERENAYREYSKRAGRIIYGLKGRVHGSGWKPIREIKIDVPRDYFLVVEFPSEAAFDRFIQLADDIDIHRLREESTTDHIWILFEPWDLKEWVKTPEDQPSPWPTHEASKEEPRNRER